MSYWGNFMFYSTARAWGLVGSKNRPIEQSLFIDEYYKQELISNDIGLRRATASYSKCNSENQPNVGFSGAC